MKRISLMLMLALSLSLNLHASEKLDKKVKHFIHQLEKEKYNEAVTDLLKGSPLAEKVLNVQQVKNSWIAQFSEIKSLYGQPLSYEKLFTKKLGNLESSYYLVYYEIYPIQIIITEYNNGKSNLIVNMVFNDQTMETLENYGEFIDHSSSSKWNASPLDAGMTTVF